jgi:shikimate kinase
MPSFGPVLVGMRGCGKSAIVRPLAEALDLLAIDADLEITRRDGRSIDRIFREEGEAYFRDLERRLLCRDLLRRPGAVIATGAGAVIHDEVRQRLDQRLTVWLVAPLHRLASRISGSDRPSLGGGPIGRELGPLLAQREPLYREVASAVVHTDDVTIGEVVEQIAGHWSRWRETSAAGDANGER